MTASTASANLALRLPAQRGAYYGGAWHAPASGAFAETLNPSTGESLGRVSALQDGGGSGLLVVGDLLIPFARSICVEIDPAAKRIAVELPEGLKDLNRP